MDTGSADVSPAVVQKANGAPATAGGGFVLAGPMAEPGPLWSGVYRALPIAGRVGEFDGTLAVARHRGALAYTVAQAGRCGKYFFYKLSCIGFHRIKSGRINTCTHTKKNKSEWEKNIKKMSQEQS